MEKPMVLTYGAPAGEPALGHLGYRDLQKLKRGNNYGPRTCVFEKLREYFVNDHEVPAP